MRFVDHMATCNQCGYAQEPCDVGKELIFSETEDGMNVPVSLADLLNLFVTGKDPAEPT